MILHRRTHQGRSYLLMGMLGLLLCLPLFTACSEDDPVEVPATGSLTLAVEGLPADAEAPISVTGPDGFTATVRGDSTLTGLAPGTYIAQAASLPRGRLLFVPDAGERTAQVAADATATLRFTYSSTLAFGQLTVDVSGLPQGVAAVVNVTGPQSYSRTVTSTETLADLVEGEYTVVAATVADGSTTYLPTPSSETTTVTAGGTSAVFVTYNASGAGTADLRIDGFEITQAIQDDANGVPMIAQREAWLRVFGVADAQPLQTPRVRIEIYNGSQIVHTEIVTAQATALPSARDRGDLSSSFNLRLQPQWVQDGLAVRAMIDPDGAIAESDETNNRYPVDGSKASITVVDVGPLPIRLVPVEVGGLTGRVDATNATDYVTDLQTMFPVQSVAVEVRTPFTSSVSTLASDGTGWSEVLREVLLLRNSDASESYYYGVLQTSYNSGVAGLGYIPSSRSTSYNAAVGWDRSNSRASVLAHEVGHNLGRYHAPCGGPANPDPNYPYPGAVIGQWGFDPRDQSLRAPDAYTDIMSYCNPEWVSDYQYREVLEFLGVALRSPSTQTVPCLVVWGEADASGAVRLDPSFVLDARPLMPERGGPHRVIVSDTSGRSLIDFDFTMPEIGCAEELGTRSFVWLVPVTPAQAEAVRRIEVRSPGSTAIRVAPSEGDQNSVAAERRQLWRLDRNGNHRARLEWEPASLPLAVIRDSRSGEMLAIARRGHLEFECPADEVLVTFSDGVRSRTVRHAFE